MREIKFRAWDNFSNKFVTAYFVDGSYPRIVLSTDMAFDMEPWQQYTGLKDKNSKEIYEGDIIASRVMPKSDRDNRNFVVESIGWAFVATPDDRYPDNSQSNFFASHADSFEVIGNIYENPNLIERSST